MHKFLTCDFELKSYFYAFKKYIEIMNKKIVILSLGIAVSGASYGQKAKINEAIKELDKVAEARIKKDVAAETAAYQKAKAAIDQAVRDESTKENAKAWFTRAAVYVGMQDNVELSESDPYKEGAEALKKAIELDKKYDKDPQAINLLANSAFFYYNEGIQTYNNSKYSEAYKLFDEGISLVGPDKDKRFILLPVIDTIRAQSKMYMGFTSYYSGAYDQSIPLLKEAKASPYLDREANVYLVLAQAYEQQGKTAEQVALLKEGKAKFPNDKNIANAELNYYIKSGKQEEMTAKLEEAIAKDPENPDLVFNLGIIYEGMVKNNPAEASVFSEKAEAAYKKALALAPDNANYHYQYGALYYNKAAELNGVMNDLGVGKADQLKYNELLKERDGLFAKALPLLEKGKDLYSAKEKNLSGEEKSFYRQSLEALSKIYSIQDRLDEAGAVKKKLSSMN